MSGYIRWQLRTTHQEEEENLKGLGLKGHIHKSRRGLLDWGRRLQLGAAKRHQEVDTHQNNETDSAEYNGELEGNEPAPEGFAV